MCGVYSEAEGMCVRTAYELPKPYMTENFKLFVCQIPEE